MNRQGFFEGWACGVRVIQKLLQRVRRQFSNVDRPFSVDKADGQTSRISPRKPEDKKAILVELPQLLLDGSHVEISRKPFLQTISLEEATDLTKWAKLTQ